jgi:protein disulfide-isomerase
MAKELQGKLNVGEVNCDVEADSVRMFELRGTRPFTFRGERVEYDGLRGRGSRQLREEGPDVGMGVRYVDAAAFKQMEETEEVIFVYFTTMRPQSKTLRLWSASA